MPDSPESIMMRLRQGTRDLHLHAESRQLQQNFSHGEVSRETFAAYIGQLYLAHQALETGLKSAGAGHEAIATLATEERMRVPDLEKDLAHYDVDPAALEPNPATARFLDFISSQLESDPVALLGALYVLEGSTNGGRFLARVLRQAWELDEESGGLAYFDPYGVEQPARWAAFRSEMDSAVFDAETRDAIFAAARETFSAIADISDEVHRANRTG